MERGGPAGYTLLEIMVVVAVVALIASIAYPVYEGYMRTSREGALAASIATMEVFQEDHRLRTGAYLRSATDTNAIFDAIGWRPKSDDGTTYSIGTGDDDGYRVTATARDGTRICMRLPDRIRC